MKWYLFIYSFLLRRTLEFCTKRGNYFTTQIIRFFIIPLYILLIHIFLVDSVKPGPCLRIRLLTADTRVYSRNSPCEDFLWMIWNEAGFIVVHFPLSFSTPPVLLAQYAHFSTQYQATTTKYSK